MAKTTTEAVKELNDSIRARRPIVVINTSERGRVLELMNQIAQAFRNRRSASGQGIEMTIYDWTLGRGVMKLDGANRSLTDWLKAPNAAGVPLHQQTINPDAALRIISDRVQATRAAAASEQARGRSGADESVNTLWIMHDMSVFFAPNPNPAVLAGLREIATTSFLQQSLILIGPDHAIPSSLADDVYVIDWPLPSAAEVAEIVTQSIGNKPANGVDETQTNPELAGQIAQASIGLTREAISLGLAQGIVNQRGVTHKLVGMMSSQKAQMVKKAGFNWIEPNAAMADIGGLENLKKFTARMRRSLTPEANERGIKAMKGLIAFGMPGTGKSMAAAAVGNGVLGVVHVNFQDLLGSLVGESERNARRLWRLLNAISPTVLWIDELNHGMSDNGGRSDGGAKRAVLATFLTEMQDARGVVVFGTANEIAGLDPAFMRRMDGVFYCDVPTAPERAEIWPIQLRAHKQNVAEFDVQALVEASPLYTGAEIAKAINMALLDAFEDGRSADTDDMIDALADVPRVAIQRQAETTAVREWAKAGGVMSASAGGVNPELALLNQAGTWQGSSGTNQRLSLDDLG